MGSRFDKENEEQFRIDVMNALKVLQDGIAELKRLYSVSKSEVKEKPKAESTAKKE